MGNLIISEHISLDGFVGGPNGEMDWINFNDELFDYVGTLTKTADFALYGRKTFDMMESYWPTAAQQPNPTKHAVQHAAWYNKVNKIVISNSMQGKDSDKVQFVNDNNLDIITEAKRNSNILCFGSPGALHTLFAKDLVDEIYLLVNPVLLGNGIALFSGIEERRKLQLKGTKQFESLNVVSLHYARV